MLRSLHLLAVSCLCMPPTLAQQGAPAPLADDDVPGWTRQLLERQNATIELLAGRGPACLPLLRQLLRDGRENVRRGVARTCERLGPSAEPMLPELIATLRSPGEWWTHLYAAQALIAIGSNDEAVLEALLDQAMHSPVPRLRAVCSRGLGALTADATRRVLAARGDAPLHDPRAVELLLALGDAAVTQQIALAQDPTIGAARELLAEALARRGWRFARQLERAGLPDLAQRALRQGPLQAVPFAEHYALQLDTPVPPVTHLPRIVGETGAGNGAPLTLLRADDRPEGYAVDRLQLRADGRGATALQLDHAVLPRVRAADAVRQLELLAAAELQKVSRPDRDGWSHNDSYDRVLVLRDGIKVLDESFAGRPTYANLPQRFRAAAAREVLDQLLHDATWTPREIDAADREQVRAALARTDDPADLVARLRHLETVLGPRRD